MHFSSLPKKQKADWPQRGWGKWRSSQSAFIKTMETRRKAKGISVW